MDGLFARELSCPGSIASAAHLQSRGRPAAVHLKTGQHLNIASLPAYACLLDTSGPVCSVELLPLPLKLAAGRALVPEAALVRVAILGPSGAAAQQVASMSKVGKP